MQSCVQVVRETEIADAYRPAENPDCRLCHDFACIARSTSSHAGSSPDSTSSVTVAG
jgi:hypothetical protein